MSIFKSGITHVSRVLGPVATAGAIVGGTVGCISKTLYGIATDLTLWGVPEDCVKGGLVGAAYGSFGFYSLGFDGVAKMATNGFNSAKELAGSVAQVDEKSD